MSNRKKFGLTGVVLMTSLLGTCGTALNVSGTETESVPGFKGTEITEYSYDEQGNLTRKSVSYNGQESEVFTYEYDEENHVVSFVDKKTDGTTISQTTQYEYTDGGYTGVTQIESEKDGKKSKTGTTHTEVVFNEDGYTETLSVEPEDGEDGYVTVTKYDNTLGVVSRSTQEAGSGKEMAEETYQYNDEGSLVSKKTTSPKKVWTEETYEYDADGFLVKKTDSIGSGDKGLPTDYSEYENDENGNCVLRKDYSAAGKLKAQEAYELDGEGRIVKDTLSDGDGNELSETVYEYDEAGLLVREERTVY